MGELPKCVDIAWGMECPFFSCHYECQRDQSTPCPAKAHYEKNSRKKPRPKEASSDEE